MKRDMELIRGLLLQVEGEEEPDLSKWTEEQQVYHMALLIEADLVHGATAEGSMGETVAAHAIRLTWDGHEFLEAARDDTVWKKAREQIAKAGGHVTLPILTALLTQFLKQQIGMP